ncbi:hypothetical protein E2C01_100988 [Portunus trituberculatus]|uniref:Uncharacterized protein n=1 Tax=Portunus trituberculatus TaxID=210409 RepID=A0A5B7KEG7_PORTR|nr:hypothetical protein [Portunus trituberculatus]
MRRGPGYKMRACLVVSDGAATEMRGGNRGGLGSVWARDGRDSLVRATRGPQGRDGGTDVAEKSDSRSRVLTLKFYKGMKQV